MKKIICLLLIFTAIKCSARDQYKINLHLPAQHRSTTGQLIPTWKPKEKYLFITLVLLVEFLAVKGRMDKLDEPIIK